jgi:hypothetical protein
MSTHIRVSQDQNGFTPTESTTPESRLEGGVNRQNLNFTTLNTHYKPGLALEQISSPGERGKQIKWKVSE